MSRARPLEIRAIVPLLEQNWETPEVLAQAIITELDRVRADRTSYVAVMQFGKERPVIYAGLGPYPGQRSAEVAVQRHPAASMATAIAVVPVISEQGFQQLLLKVG